MGELYENCVVKEMITCLRFLAISLLCQVPLSYAAPKLVCDEPTFDFGARDTAEVVNHSLTSSKTGTGRPKLLGFIQATTRQIAKNGG